MSETLPDTWFAHELGDLMLKIEGGGTPSRTNPNFWDGLIPWATVKDLKGIRLSSTEESVTEQGILASSSRLVPAKTPIIATRMAVGKAVVFDKAVAINQDLKAVYPSKSLNADFFLHWYLAHSEQVSSLATGSTVKGIRLETLRALPLALPPLPEQQKIATILSSVDDVIEKTRAQIDKLKDLKTGMMQELLTQGIGHTEFKDSPVGRVPASWGITDLRSAVTKDGLQTGPFGSQLHAHEYIEWGIPVVMPKDMSDNRVETSSIARISPQKADELRKHSVRSGDILFSRRGDVGRFVLITEKDEGAICGTGCLRARLSEVVSPFYLACYLTLPKIVEWLNANAVGQTMLNLNTSILGNLPVVLPSKPEQDSIGQTIMALEENIQLKSAKLWALEKHKKALMQDLLTGTVRVKVAPTETAAA